MIRKVKDILPLLKNHITLVLLISTAIINDLTLRALTVGNVFYWKPIITSVAIILMLSLFTLSMNHKRRNRIYVLISVYFGVLSGINYLYYKHYKSFLSVAILNQIKQLAKLGDSVTKTIDPRIFFFAIPTILLIFAIYKLNKVQFFKDIEGRPNRRIWARPLMFSIGLLALVAVTFTNSDWSRLAKQWNKPYLVEQLGIYSYSMADIIKNLSTRHISAYNSEEAIKVLEEYIDQRLDKRVTNRYTDIFKGKDVYIIHYESAQNFAMDLEFEGREVTPFLNRLASEGLFFNNFHPQHSVGTSSDTEFTFNTSLLPIQNGTVFLTHFDREYVTLPKLLKERGYFTFSMHGNNGDFWNRKMMHQSLGYDRFFHQEDYVVDEEIGLGLSDKSFFKQSIDKIRGIKENQDNPIMATLITLTHHYPFSDVDKYGEFNVGHLEGTDVGNYLKSYHYADQALQSFIEGLDEAGLLDNAVIVLYGDHHANISKKDFERIYNYDVATETYYTKNDQEYYAIDEARNKQLQKTPFIVWSKDSDVKGVISTPMGMIDALPTLGNMLGIYNPYQLGKDIIGHGENIVVFPNGDWLNSSTYYSASSSRAYAFEDMDWIIERNVDSITSTAESTIELSNSIIKHDLIKYYNSLLAENKIANPKQKTLLHRRLNI